MLSPSLYPLFSVCRHNLYARAHLNNYIDSIIFLMIYKHANATSNRDGLKILCHRITLILLAYTGNHYNTDNSLIRTFINHRAEGKHDI